MKIERVEILVEEPSMEQALRVFIPKILSDVSFALYPHRGKEDLLRALPGRLLGYRQWIPANWHILVVVDRDDDDCRELKARIDSIAQAAGFRTGSTHLHSPHSLVTRIAIEELE